MDSDLSGGQRYSSFEQLGPEEEAEVAILNTELFKFSFDTQSHKVTDIDPIHI